MRARAVVVAAPGARPGEVRFDALRSDPPLLLRPTALGLHLVGGAAGPLGGDALELDITVRSGAHLAVRSAAATMVLPGAERSELQVRAVVEEEASLDWHPEPTVSVTGSRHRQLTVIELGMNAGLRWTETLVFGRTGERGGDLEATMRLERDDGPVLHQTLACGPDTPGSGGVACLGHHRVIRSDVWAGSGCEPPTHTHRDDDTDTRGMLVPLGPEVALAQAVGPDVPAVDACLTSLRRPEADPDRTSAQTC